MKVNPLTPVSDQDRISNEGGMNDQILGVKGLRIPRWRDTEVRETGDKKRRPGARNNI